MGGGGGSLLNLAPNYVTTNRPLMTKVMGITTFYSDYLTEYCTLFDDFTNATVDPHIDSLVDLIAPHVYADVNKQYTSAQFDTNISSNISVGGGGGAGGTVYGLKSFITSRRNYLNGVLDCTTLGTNEIATTTEPRVWPNPASDLVNLDLPSDASLLALDLLDASGRLMRTGKDGTVDVREVQAGYYLLDARTTDGRRWRTPVIVQ